MKVVLILWNLEPSVPFENSEINRDGSYSYILVLLEPRFYIIVMQENTDELMWVSYGRSCH